MRLIDADALRVQVEYSRKDNPYTGAPFGSLSAVYDIAHRHILNIIDDAPTIDAEPVRHGWWIPMYEVVERLTTKGWVLEEAQTAWKCSECGREELKERGTMPYCHCGAKMYLEVEHD